MVMKLFVMGVKVGMYDDIIVGCIIWLLVGFLRLVYCLFCLKY